MSTIDRQAVIETLSRLVTPGIKLTALADELGAHKHQYAALREVILDLVEDGTVQVLPGGAFALAPSGRPGDPAARPTPPVKPEPPRSHQKKPTPAPRQKAKPRFVSKAHRLEKADDPLEFESVQRVLARAEAKARKTPRSQR